MENCAKNTEREGGREGEKKFRILEEEEEEGMLLSTTSPPSFLSPQPSSHTDANGRSFPQMCLGKRSSIYFLSMQCSSIIFNTLCDCINLTALSTKTLLKPGTSVGKTTFQSPFFKKGVHFRNARMPNFALPPFLHFPPSLFLLPPPAPSKKGGGEGKEQRVLSLCRGGLLSPR